MGVRPSGAMRTVVGKIRLEPARRRGVRVIVAMRDEMPDRRQLGCKDEDAEQEVVQRTPGCRGMSDCDAACSL